MTETNSIPTKIDRRLLGEQIEIDDRSVQPVARVRGRCGAGGNKQGAGAGCQLSVEPVEVIVREADGAVSTLALDDPTAQALRTMAGLAIAVALLSITLAVLARSWRRSRLRRSPVSLELG